MSYRRSYRRPVRRPRNVVLRSRFKMERKQRIRTFSKVTLTLGLSALVVWAVWIGVSGFLFNSDIFRIRKIEIEGNRVISSNEIVALLPFREGDNLFKIWLSQAEDNVRQCKPELKKISMHRRWHRVLITLEERRPLACVMQNGQRLGLDEDNQPFPLRGKLSREPLPEIVATPATDRPEVLRFIALFSVEAKQLFPQIARLSLAPVDDIMFETKDNLRVYWGRVEKDVIRRKLRRLDQVLADAKARFAGIEYVNLCFFDDGRIIVKPLRAAAAPVKTMAEK